MKSSRRFKRIRDRYLVLVVIQTIIIPIVWILSLAYPNSCLIWLLIIFLIWAFISFNKMIKYENKWINH